MRRSILFSSDGVLWKKIFLYFIPALFLLPSSLNGQDPPVTHSLPDAYPIQIGNTWEYTEWIFNADCTQTVTLDTTAIYYTKVEVIRKDRLFGKDLFRVKYTQVLQFPESHPNWNRAYVTHDWELIEDGDLKLIGYDSSTRGLVTEYSKLWKTADAAADTSFEEFTVLTNEIFVLDFPLSPGKRWTGSTHPVFGNLVREVRAIDTIQVGDNILPSYKVNYGFDREDIYNWTGLVLNVWFSEFGKTRFEQTTQQFDILGNFIRKYEHAYGSLISFSEGSLPTTVDEVSKEESTPNTFTLKQNYPNPFNPETTIEFELPSPANITLSVYNIMGQQVRTLARGIYAEGSHNINWDGKNGTGLPASGGVYLLKLEANNQVQVRKMVLLR